MISTLLHLADWLLWLFVAASAGYVVFFAAASLLHRPAPAVPLSVGVSRRFLVIIPAYGEDSVIRSTVEAFLQQEYPSSHYQLAVVSDHMQAATNEWLARQSLTLLLPQFEKSSKARALQYAIEHCTAAEADYVVVLDADNHVAPDFLKLLAQACAPGYKAVQCHRTAKNDDNDIAVLDGVSEEINNTLFRQAHNNIGLSSALIGSGMCFDYQWFRANVASLDSAVEDRELEALLLRQHIFVKYEAGINVMDEKVSSGDNFQRQRLRWMTGQIQALLQMLPYIPQAIRQGNIDYIDKTIQQMLIPRSILLVILPFMAVLTTVLAWLHSVKWWLLLLLLCVALFVATPRRLRTKAIFGKLWLLPSLTWRMLKNLARIDKNNKDFLHTTHTS